MMSLRALLAFALLATICALTFAVPEEQYFKALADREGVQKTESGIYYFVKKEGHGTQKPVAGYTFCRFTINYPFLLLLSGVFGISFYMYFFLFYYFLIFLFLIYCISFLFLDFFPFLSFPFFPFLFLFLSFSFYFFFLFFSFHLK